MATPKKKVYVDIELEYAEQQLRSWREYIDDNPIHELVDRIEWIDGKYGQVPKVIQSKENQIKCVQDLLVKYLTLLKEVNEMREGREMRVAAKGDMDIPHRMKKANGN
jgi:hypothetical protein